MADDTKTPTFASGRIEGLTTITYRKRKLEMYPVFDHELKELGSGYSSPHLGLCGMALGTFVTLLITVLTVPLSEAAKTRFIVLCVVFGVFMLYFGIMAARDWSNAKQRIKKIRSETVGTVEVAVIEGPPKLPE